MHTLLIPVGSLGDVHPFIGLGTVLKKRGHKVTVITNGYFRAVVERAGLGFIELGTAEEFHAVADNPDLWDPNRSFFVIAKQTKLALRPMYEVIKKHFIPGETVVAAGSLALSARIAEEKLKIPTAMIHLQPGIFRSVYDPPVFPTMSIPRWFPPFAVKAMYGLVDFMVDRVMAGEVNGFRRELGLKPVRGIFGDWWNSPRLTVGMFPDWFYTPQKDWPTSIKLTGFPLYDGDGVEVSAPGLKEFLDAGPAPVVFTAGSAMKMSGDFFKESVEACRILKCRGVLISRFDDQIPSNLPEGVRHFSYLPFSRIFPHAATVVHHGGIGTTAQALAAGVPQLVMPFTHDQPDNAARIECLGVGLSLASKKYHAEKVASILKILAEDQSFKKNARILAWKIDKSSGLEKTCDLIEAL